MTFCLREYRLVILMSHISILLVIFFFLLSCLDGHFCFAGGFLFPFFCALTYFFHFSLCSFFSSPSCLFCNIAMFSCVFLPPPPSLFSHRHLILAGRAVLMMVMSGNILQVVDRVCPSGGEYLPLVATDAQQPIIPPVPVVAGAVALL